jgi:hypothetical protein
MSFPFENLSGFQIDMDSSCVMELSGEIIKNCKAAIRLMGHG